MEVQQVRTGSMACALQAALRLGNVAFAAHVEISVRMGRCLASEEVGACARGWRCSSFPALPLGRSRRWSWCDSPCSHVSSAMPGRACRSAVPSRERDAADAGNRLIADRSISTAPSRLDQSPGRRGGSIYDRHGGGIIDREERKYPEMPGREEQEYFRMLAEDPWADGTERDSGWTDGTDDE
jgi:hypothetical protein